MKDIIITIVVISLMTILTLAWIDEAKRQWISSVAENNPEISIDFCGIDDTLTGCDDPNYK